MNVEFVQKRHKWSFVSRLPQHVCESKKSKIHSIRNERLKCSVSAVVDLVDSSNIWKVAQVEHCGTVCLRPFCTRLSCTHQAVSDTCAQKQLYLSSKPKGKFLSSYCFALLRHLNLQMENVVHLQGARMGNSLEKAISRDASSGDEHPPTREHHYRCFSDCLLVHHLLQPSQVLTAKGQKQKTIWQQSPAENHRNWAH